MLLEIFSRAIHVALHRHCFVSERSVLFLERRDELRFGDKERAKAVPIAIAGRAADRIVQSRNQRLAARYIRRSCCGGRSGRVCLSVCADADTGAKAATATPSKTPVSPSSSFMS